MKRILSLIVVISFFVSGCASIYNAGSQTILARSADNKEGVKHTVLSVGKHKAEGNPHEPLSDDAKAHMLSTMTEMYDMFVEDVARAQKEHDVRQVVFALAVLGSAFRARTLKRRSHPFAV